MATECQRHASNDGLGIDGHPFPSKFIFKIDMKMWWLTVVRVEKGVEQFKMQMTVTSPCWWSWW